MAYRVGSAVATHTNSNSSTTVTVNGPTGVQAGDIILLIENSLGGTTSSVMSCSGFTYVAGGQTGGPAQGPSCTMAFLWKVAGASEPSTYSVTLNSANFNNYCVIAAAWTGRSATQVGASQFTATAGTGSPVSVTLAGVTAAAGDDLIFFACGNNGASNSWTPPTGFATAINDIEPTSSWNTYLAYKNNASAGATGSLVAVETGVGVDNIGMVIALSIDPVTYDPITACFPIGYYE